MNATVIGCTGFDGGRLKELTVISFHVQTRQGEYGLVEDMHMIYTYFISLKENCDA